MSWINVKCFKCLDCGRVYEEQPVMCECRKVKLTRGSPINSFVIVDLIGMDRCVATCRLCDMNGEYYIGQLRSMISCGCRPAWVEILSIEQSVVKYRCKKCQHCTRQQLPVVVWCCSSDSER